MKSFAIVTWIAALAAVAQVDGHQPKDQIDPQIKTEVIKVLDDYMSAWNSMDLAAWERTFHFPHYRLAGGTMSVLERSGRQDVDRIRAQIGKEWHHSKWDRRSIIHASPDKVHVNTRFTRYRADGSAMGSYDSFYILTKEDGRWGVKLRSSYAR